MRKFLLLAIFVAISCVFLNLKGINTAYLRQAPAMLNGMAAKLVCSGHYVSGLSKSKAQNDLLSYSPAFSLVSIDFDDDRARVDTHITGLSPVSAQFRENLGCSLELGNTAPLDSLVVPTPSAHEGEYWPKGNNPPAYNSDAQKALDALLRKDNQSGLNTRALLVARDGQLIAEAYAPGYTEQSKLLGWSMAKTVTAAMIGNLQMSGLLKMTDSGLFSEWSDDARRDITIADMLTMTSGLDFNEDYGPGEKATRMLFESHSASDYALQAPLIRTPGTYYEYSSGTTNLLSRIAHEKLGGDPQASIDYVFNELFAPMAMENTVFELDSSGVFVGSSYMYASARDWGRIGQLFLNRGEINGSRLFSVEWYEQAVTPNASTNERAYGFKLWLNRGDKSLRWPDLPVDSYALLGNRKQLVMVIPSLSLVFVRLGWSDGDYPTSSNIAQFLQAF